MSREEAIVVCLRTDEAVRVTPGSQRGHCARCGHEVWLDTALLREVGEQRPDADLVIECRQCFKVEPDSEMLFSPGQVRRLRSQGATDPEIAELFALAKVARSGDLKATRLRIAALPDDDPDVIAFRRHLDDATVYVALTPK